MQRYLSLFLVFFVFQTGFSQGLPENYQKAKSALANEDYWSSINGFKEYLDAGKFGNLANYAAFHSAEAYLKVNQPAQAIEVLRPVYSRNWSKSDEMKYLLALGYFQNGQTLDGMRMVQQIKSEEIMTKAQYAVFEFLVQASPTFLVTNLQEFKSNPGYTSAMAFVLQQKEIMTAGEREALKIVGQSNSKVGAKQDEVLDIVVILPFTTGNTSISSISSNDFIFELYQGILAGVNQLKSEGVPVQMQTFDSKRDLKYIGNLLKDPALENADVIIGPIYPDETDLVSQYAESEKIPFIHPLSNLGDRFEQLKYSYLFRPSVQALSEGILAAMKKENWGKRVAIGYSTASRDQALASLLKDKLSREGYDLLNFQEVDRRNVIEFFNDLGIRGRGDSVLRADQVILLGDDPAIAQPVFALFESVTISVPTLVMDSWVSFNFANFEMIEFPNLYFIYNNTPNFGTEAMNAFRDRFYSKNLALPSLNAILGSELIFWIKSNFSEFSDLRRGLDSKSYQPGKLTHGFNFQNSNSNQFSPILKLENGELIPLN
ncbi:hypothetical protein [Algoriphagus confluentis]|uniref:Receptor ligand binding region domain-containing protein n=1 Tax=Algoriphagus confluentis TaxID=1697556 RepID=A0ABQ6PUY2_9BACT|nr:hypothetical protein Aconfl_42080 [Algoriphagus confluentis]